MKDGDKRQGEAVRKNGTTPQSQPVPQVQNVGLSPVIYFDNAPCFGVFSGHIVEVELAARVMSPRSDATVATGFISVGHLRCSIESAISLRNALNGALAMIEQANAGAQTH